MKTSVIAPTEFLLPKADFEKWAVIACDQFTQSVEYWQGVENIVGQTPSTLRLIVPEVYLSETEARVQNAQATMASYLSDGVLQATKPGGVFVVRQLGEVKRNGFVCALDLDVYDFAPDTKLPIRASERTILERLAARAQVRRGACLELSHAIVLIDDPENRVFGDIELENTEKCYDFALMESDDSRIVGYNVSGDEFQKLAERLTKLLKSSYLIVGDGNHSLAAAKLVWEEAKKTLTDSEQKTSPLKYYTVELQNIYDGGIEFFPIHRVLYNAPEKLEVQKCDDVADYTSAVDRAIEQYIAKNPAASVDYVHGDEELARLSKLPNTQVFEMPTMCKATFFATVEKHKVLPKKCFSIGQAKAKRYYLEVRAL